jgi:hypothetical protein
MRNGISTSNSGNTSASASVTVLSQRSRLRKRSHQDQQQRDENHGAADQQQDLAEHIRVHQIFRVHLRLPLHLLGTIVALGVPSRFLSIVAALCLETTSIGQVGCLFGG